MNGNSVAEPLAWSSAPYPSFSLSEGCSQAGTFVMKLFRRVPDHLRNNTSASDHLSETLMGIQELLRECAREGWDGYGAAPVSRRSSQMAIAFAGLLPPTATPPFVDADPDGRVVFEWRGGRRRACRVSFGPGDRFRFAALTGARTMHGEDRLRDSIPRYLMDLIYEASRS